jgi:hypothetical protein
MMNTFINTVNPVRGQRRRMKTGFLFPTPSFLSGVGSVLDIFGRPGPFNYSRSGVEADCKALYSDYRMIGQDIEDAILVFVAEHPDAFPEQARLFDPEKVERVS